MKYDKLQLYYQLYELSRQQKEAIYKADKVKILDLQQRKREILNELEGVELKSEILNCCKPMQTLREIQFLLDELVKMEKNNLLRLKKH